MPQTLLPSILRLLVILLCLRRKLSAEIYADYYLQKKIYLKSRLDILIYKQKYYSILRKILD